MPVRALVCCGATVLFGVALTLLVSYWPAEVEDPGSVVVEVDAGDGPGRVFLFPAPPDQCSVLAVAGIDGAACDAAIRMGAGSALFVLPGGRLRMGWMAGADLLTLGLPMPINSASAEELEAIPGIGPAMALAIVADRVRSGPFKSVRDLDRVKGIGPKKAAGLEGIISCSPWPAAEAPPSR